MKQFYKENLQMIPTQLTKTIQRRAQRIVKGIDSV